MIPIADVKAWRAEVAQGPSKVVYDDIGEDYKQRSVEMTFNYERYVALLDEVLQLTQLHGGFQLEINNLRKNLTQAKDLLRAYPGCGDARMHDIWLADVATALG